MIASTEVKSLVAAYRRHGVVLTTTIASFNGVVPTQAEIDQFIRSQFDGVTGPVLLGLPSDKREPDMQDQLA